MSVSELKQIIGRPITGCRLRAQFDLGLAPAQIALGRRKVQTRAGNQRKNLQPKFAAAICRIFSTEFANTEHQRLTTSRGKTVEGA